MNLDQPSRFEQVDSGAMLGHVRGLPQQCREAWALARDWDFPEACREAYGGVRHVVIIGIGGSAIGGTLLQSLVAGECTVPVSVVRDYQLPSFVRGPEYLVIGCSYSGNTEETLSAMHEALERQVRLLVVTTGGRLAGLASERGIPSVRYEYASQPRAALGYSLVLLLGTCWRLGLVRDYAPDLDEAVRVMEHWQTTLEPGVPTEGNAAKALALAITGRLPVVYGAGHLVAVANRWKTQLNENAKVWSFSEAMPELQHNSVVGYDSSQAVRGQITVVMLRSPLDHPRVQVRWGVTREMLERAGVAVEGVTARGESPLAQMLSLIHFGDYVSTYLALVNDVDPTPVDAIAFLKRRLAEIGQEQ